MTAPAGDAAYNPSTWSLGYQMRQFGVAGPDVIPAMSNPPTSMVNADHPETA